MAVKLPNPPKNDWPATTGLFSAALFALTLSKFTGFAAVPDKLPEKEFMLPKLIGFFCDAPLSAAPCIGSEPKTDGCCEVNNPGGWLLFSSFLFVLKLKREGASGFCQNKEGTGTFLLA